VVDEHLGFVFKAAERGRVDYPLPVPLKIGAIGVLLLRVFPSLGIAALGGIWRQESSLVIL